MALTWSGFEPAAAHVDEDGGGGLHALLGEQQAVFRLHDHHAGGADARQLGDRAGELALHGPQVIGALDEIAQAELALVENLKAHAVAARQALAGQSPCGACRRGRRARTAVPPAETWWGCSGLKIADDGGGILVPQPRIEQLVVGRRDQKTSAAMPPMTTRVATISETRWLRPSCFQRASRDWAKFFIRLIGEGGSDLHAHQFLVGFHELVADLDHEGKRRRPPASR
jgi:hypothetical protein